MTVNYAKDLMGLGMSPFLANYIAPLLGPAVSPAPGGSYPQVQINAGGGNFGGVTISGDGSLSASGVLTVTESQGQLFVNSAFVDATNASNISSGTLPYSRLPIFSSSTAGAVPASGGSSITYLSGNGTWTVPAAGILTVGSSVITGGSAGNILADSGGTLAEYTTTGTGTVVALAAGPTFSAPILGTPASGTLTNCTGLPISSGISGLGANVATALAIAVGSAGAVVTNGGALGTPSSGTLTNCTGLPVSSGISGLGTGVATALAVAVGSAGAFVTNGGALGTPSSGTLTNCTGYPASQLSGQVAVANGGTGASTLTAHAVLLGEGTSAVSSVGPGTSGQVLKSQGSSADPQYKNDIAAITFVIGNVNTGSVIGTGLAGWVECPFGGTITQVTLLTDQSGSIEVDIWKCTYAQYQPGTHPVSGDSITASDKPTISSTYKYTDSTLTGWTTTINAGDILAFDVVSASTVEQCTVTLYVNKA